MLRLVAVLSAATLAYPLQAFSDEYRQLGPHQHGHGTLNVAVEGKSLKMELEVPGDDIVGFEHDPSNAEQKTAIEKAKAALGQPLVLFTIPSSAQCVVKDAKVTIQEEKHEGEEAGGHEEDAGAHHNEFYVEYALDCASVENVKSLQLAYFKTFENAQTLTVNIITTKGQTKVDVTRDKPEIDLSNLM